MDYYDGMGHRHIFIKHIWRISTSFYARPHWDGWIDDSGIRVLNCAYWNWLLVVCSPNSEVS